MKKPWLMAGVGVLYFLFGGAIAYSLYSTPPAPDIEVQLYLLEKKIDVDKPIHPQISAVSRHYLAKKIALTDGSGFRVEFTPRQVGVSADLKRLERTIDMIATNKGDIARFLQKHKSGSSGRIDLTLPVRIDYPVIQDFLLNLKFDYDRKSQNAKFNMETRKVSPHKEGRQLILDDSIAVLELSMSEGKEEIRLAANISRPARMTEELRDIDISEVLGWFETPYCLMKKCWDRNHNLKLGGQMLDGTIVWPGETFDFNEALGPRSEAKGFRPAPTIEQGILTETPGGGTCQTASTLYAAAFFAGMDLDQRRPHSRPSGYILLGLDATVTYPTINLKFQNPFDFPVVIHYKVENGKMKVEILGSERKRLVHFVRRITQKTPFKENVIEEPDWPKGVSVVTQLGIDGYRVRRYRLIWEDNYLERELTETVYPSTVKTVHVGTNPSLPAKGFEPPLGPDSHTPYEADERIRYYLDEKSDFKKIIAGW
ncbi:MAG: VanW family protein [Pseudomonadota bacterium]